MLPVATRSYPILRPRYTYTVLPEELEAARKGLGAQQARSRASRTAHPRLADPAFRSLVQSILKTHSFELPLDEALNALVSFDHVIIQHAEAAFFVARQRDGFDPRKSHFAYFMGIVRNKQKELDQARLGSRLDHYAAQTVFDESAAQDAAIAKEDQQERGQLATEPEKVILKYSHLLMRGRFRLMRDTWLARIREGLKALRRLGRTTRIVLENLTIAIRGFSDFAEDVKERMGRILAEEFAAIVGT